MIGQGSFYITNPNNTGGGGGTVNAAQNATSIVGGNTVELGLNPLLHDTAFDLAGFGFEITGNGGFKDALFLNDSLGSEEALLSTTGINNLILDLNDPGEEARISENTTGKIGIDLLFGNNDYKFGDTQSINNGTYLDIDDGNENFSVFSKSGIARGIELDFLNNNYQLGDIQGVNNNVILNVLDGIQDVQIQNALGVFLDIDIQNGQYKIGDIDNTRNGLKFLLNDTGQDASIFANATQRILDLSVSSSNYSFGDLDVIANGYRMIIHDALGQFDFVNAANGVIGQIRPAGISTLPPGGSSAPWLLGDIKTAAVTPDATRYLEVNINGTPAKIALVN